MISRPTMVFTELDKLNSTEFANANIILAENHGDNGASMPLVTQPSYPHSTLTETSLDLVNSLPRPHVESRDGETSLFITLFKVI